MVVVLWTVGPTGSYSYSQTQLPGQAAVGRACRVGRHVAASRARRAPPTSADGATMEATSSVLVSPGVSRFTVPTRYTGRCLLCAGRSRAPGLPVELQTATSDEYRAVPRWQYPRRSGLLTWLLLVNIPSIAFLSLVAPYLAREVSPALFIIGVASLIINSVLMGVAGCSDPGTVPAAAFRSGTHDPRPREVLINGQRVTVKFCVACGIRVRAQSPNAESPYAGCDPLCRHVARAAPTARVTLPRDEPMRRQVGPLLPMARQLGRPP